MNDSPLPLSRWIEIISENGLPAFKATISIISKIDDKDEMSVNQLADFILKDPGLLANILRKTQGVYKIPSRDRQNTLSRAIVLLGINEIKSLCLSLSLFEDMKASIGKDEYLTEIGETFLAALLSKEITIAHGQKNGEEVFIATLLSKIGPLGFWSLGDSYTEILTNALIYNENKKSSKVEKQTLGFTLEKLTNSLITEWELEDFFHRINSESKVFIKLGFKIAQNLKFGWDSTELKNTIHNTSVILNINEQNALKFIKQNLENANCQLTAYGLPTILGTMVSPIPRKLDSNLKHESNSIENHLKTEVDVRCQLNAFQNINKTIESGGDIYDLINIATKCMHDCLAIDRVVYAEVVGNSNRLESKINLTKESSEICNLFNVKINTQNLLGEVLQSGKALLKTKAFNISDNPNLSHTLAELIEKNEFILIPITHNNNPLGLFYLDRGVRKIAFEQEEFDSIKHLIFQLELAFEYLKNH